MRHSDALLQEYGRLASSRTLARLRQEAAQEPFRVHVPDGSLYGTLTFWSGQGLDMEYGYEAAERLEPYVLRMRLRYQGQGSRGWFDAGNVRYLVSEAGKAPDWVRRLYPLAWMDPGAGLEVYENPGVWPRAFVASRILVEPDLGRQAVILGTPGLLPRGAAVLRAAPDFLLDPGATGSARIVRHGCNEVELRVESSGPALLVLSETLATGWSATLDNVAVPIIPVNYLFRGVALPGGGHVLRFSYRPRGFVPGCWLSLGALAALAGLFWTARRR